MAAAEQLELLREIRDSLQQLNNSGGKNSQGGRNGSTSTSPRAEAVKKMASLDIGSTEGLMEGCKILTAADVSLQEEIFARFDTDNSSRLSQMEVKRMLGAMNLFETTEQLVDVIKEMDSDNSGTIEFDEYIEYIDNKCAFDLAFLKAYRERSANTKLGYDGTSWRHHGNVSWLTNNGVMIITAIAVLGVLMELSYILVPLTMAYFLTFLLGPIQDILIQRPLLCMNYVCCDKPRCRPGQGKDASCLGKTMRWDAVDESGRMKYMTPRERVNSDGLDPEETFADGQWNDLKGRLDWEEQSGCCYATPPAACKEGVRRELWALLNIAKIPDALSVAMAFLVAIGVLGAIVVVVGGEFEGLSNDKGFGVKLVQARRDMNGWLRDNHMIELSDLEPQNDTVVTYSIEGLLAASAPIMAFLNDLILTLLLTLYMLMTRVPPTEEEVHKDVQFLTLFEKIKAKVSFYVVLKSALSVLTGGLVGITLLICKVRLATVFGLLSFILNYIPNVGSVIAMMLPLPIIWLDDSLSYGAQLSATLVPVLIQGYVGNFLEPAVFGSSLNVTALSVLAALVFWGSIWGLQGAVLSVPLLAAMKIALEEADYPLAKMILRMVRESASIDDQVESTKKRSLLKSVVGRDAVFEVDQDKNKEEESTNPMMSPKQQVIDFDGTDVESGGADVESGGVRPERASSDANVFERSE